MRTAVRRVLLLSALMSPGALYALGLGEIHLKSALNQPFDAEIELVSATQEDLGALRAALASNDTFVRYGVDRPAYLSDFDFRVTKGPGGSDVLKVTSPRPVTEPFVTLLVEANWPRGRLLREYTVLLDPPVFTPGPAAAETVATPQVASGSTGRARADAPVAQAVQETSSDSAEVTPAAPAPAAASIEPGSTYRVRRNDTLWKIASSVSPGARADVNRAMVSIFQSNPEAFDGNINVLRSGSTLRIPDAGQIEGISASAAAAEVRRQYDAWRSGTASAAGEGAAAGRLRLVTPEQGTAVPSTAVAPDPSTPTASGAAPATPSADIEARVRQLESELAEARRLLEVRNAELATLQGGTPVTEAPVPGAATPAPGEPPVSGPTPAAEAPAPGEEAVAPVAKPDEPVKKKRPAAAPAEPTLLERLSDYWWVIVALLAAVLGAALFQRMRRDRGSAEDSLEAALGSRDVRATPKYTPRSRDTDILVEEKRAVEPTRTAAGSAAIGTAAAAAARAADSGRRTVAVEDTLTGDAATAGDSGDPLAEADFHMAYGLYDQAADLVQVAMKREPQRRDLKLKLLEIFFVWGNRDRFLELARDLNSTRSAAPAGEWDKILIMGKQIAPHEPMFAAAPSAGGDSLDMELHSSAGTLDMDISGAGSSTRTDLDLTEVQPELDEAGGLDFMLDGSGDPSESQVAPTIEQPGIRPETGGDTEELTVDALGLDVGSLRDIEALDEDDTVNSPGGPGVEDTVETPKARPGGGAHSLLDDDDPDALGSTSMINTLDATAFMEADAETIDLSGAEEALTVDATGMLPTLADDAADAAPRTRSGFDLGGEPPTMSEVGTKLDLARAYMDMGDPEGARSILDEVLQEGSPMQRQEAERLIASLP